MLRGLARASGVAWRGAALRAPLGAPLGTLPCVRAPAAPSSLAASRLLCTGSGGDGDGNSGGKKGDGRPAATAVLEEEEVDTGEVASEADDAVEASDSTGDGGVAESDSTTGTALKAELHEEQEGEAGDTLMKYNQDNISAMPPVLIFPFSTRPLFPGVYQPCEVTDDGLVAALISAKASSHPFIGVFLPRAAEGSSELLELSNISDPDQIHEVGTLAQITRLTQTPRGVQILLLGGRRITLGRVVQERPVMLAKVEEASDVIEPEGAGPSLAKAYSMEVSRRGAAQPAAAHP